MKNTMSQTGKITVSLLLLVLVSCSPDPQSVSAVGGADLILINGRVYTLNWDEPSPDGTASDNAPINDTGWYPDAEAVAIKGDEIIFVGGTTDALEFRGEATRVVDLAGATVVPGLVDSHTHVYGLGARLDSIDLTEAESEEDAVALVAERVRSTPLGEWVIGRGWDEGAWADRYPDKALLSQSAPDNPVFMGSLHGFAAWVNQAALDAGGSDGIRPWRDAPILVVEQHLLHLLAPSLPISFRLDPAAIGEGKEIGKLQRGLQ